MDHTKNLNEPEISKARLDYSLRWYDMHNRQRMTLFNFFVIITGILANAYVVATNVNSPPALRVALCILGTLQSIGFFFFDIRSRQLIRYGEDMLEKLERDWIFPDWFKGLGGVTLGLVKMDAKNMMREGQHIRGFLFRLGRLRKMKVWMRLMHLTVFSGFLVGLIKEMF